MRTVRRLFYRDILSSVGFVAAAFIGLFYFIDFVDDLDTVGRGGRAAWHVALASLYQVPSHFYDLFPIAVLIGTIYALARMAQASEYTILRTGGLGPGRALRLLATLGVAFGALNFVVGDYLTPWADRASLLLTAQFDGVRQIGGAGAWLKERHPTAEGEHSVSINVGGVAASGRLQGVRAYEFDADGRLVSRTSAREADVAADGTWTLHEVRRTTWPRARSDAPLVRDETLPQLTIKTGLDARVVAAAVLPLSSMTTLELWRYRVHLDDQSQASAPVEIRFWKKALYPLSCLVMVALALPFAYLHARAGSVSLKVFGGIMLGIGFVLLNNLAGHIGMLRDWTPWVVASAPSLLFLLLSLAAFAWLVRYR
ncbi:MAG: LPS export ABC transporter permease LptG [Proteobacteria bacterium]|nr:LPS export ABC transporter permease LptG [Pseudomonadota bacterium]